MPSKQIAEIINRSGLLVEGYTWENAKVNKYRKHLGLKSYHNEKKK